MPRKHSNMSVSKMYRDHPGKTKPVQYGVIDKSIWFDNDITVQGRVAYRFNSGVVTNYRFTCNLDTATITLKVAHRSPVTGAYHLLSSNNIFIAKVIWNLLHSESVITNKLAAKVFAKFR